MSPARPSETHAELRAAIEPIVGASGLFLEDVTVASAGRRTVVRVVVDLPDGPGGVGSDQLANVSREVSRMLDDADLVAGAYTLEVTTPGTDRPLTEPRHFSRAVGRLLAVRTTEGRELTGRVRTADASGVVLDVDGAAEELGYDRLSSARVEIELNRPEA